MSQEGEKGVKGARIPEEEELEVVWDGKDPLLPPRSQHPDDTWTAPKRSYKWTGKHVGKAARWKARRKLNSPIDGQSAHRASGQEKKDD